MSEKPTLADGPGHEPVGDFKAPLHEDTTLSVDDDNLPLARPEGWKYQARNIGPLSIPWFASPKFQLVMVSFVCFLCPGMFNALGGLGGGGKTDATLADNMVSWLDP